MIIRVLEALELRVLSVQALDAVIISCRKYGDCNILDPHLSIGSRGMFLQAYQGLWKFGGDDATNTGRNA